MQISFVSYTTYTHSLTAFLYGVLNLSHGVLCGEFLLAAFYHCIKASGFKAIQT